MARDFWALGLVGAAAFAAVAYALRSAWRGRVRPERLRGVGGGMLGRGTLEAMYWLIPPLVRGCRALGLTANRLSWLSLGAAAAAGVLLGIAHLGLAAIAATASAIFDILDGEVARAAGDSSDGGELLDAAVDRYGEFFFLAGAIVYYRQSHAAAALALGALLGSFMVSYSTAKAEALGVEAPGGAMRRHERAVFLIAGCAFSPFAPASVSIAGIVLPTPTLIFALTLIAVAGNLSAITRLIEAARRLRARR
jgi:phosphatidylglycerophosphate synthase